jgi:hypothetical protein
MSRGIAQLWKFYICTHARWRPTSWRFSQPLWETLSRPCTTWYICFERHRTSFFSSGIVGKGPGAFRGVGVSVGWWMLSRLLIPDRHGACLMAQKAYGTESYTVSSRTESGVVPLPLKRESLLRFIVMLPIISNWPRQKKRNHQAKVLRK